ncbi:hypothetical protein HanXRQr2_Chr09g0361721 [Helianthus annuus]|uniref:Uncharacterized protein n=1 Tax=Helianthus annuus TaxID=4232 RepID=A0A9K3N612_HELAN|nr:hypothetical protein HanXRQr2_Chr09g0361721 [Helianthus annuus]
MYAITVLPALQISFCSCQQICSAPTKLSKKTALREREREKYFI